MIKPIAALFCMLLTWCAVAQVPATLSYQGLLTDANSAPVADGSHTVTFNFYTASTGGTPAFTRGPVTVTTFKGMFTAMIGNGQGTNNTALPYTLGSAQYYVGIRPDNATADLTPLVQLTAVPYAFVAQSVNSVDGAAITSGTVPDARLSVHLQDLADGSLTGSKVGTGINAANITAGTLPANVLPTAAVMPVGTIIAFGGTTVPTGWLQCDGTAISRTTYSGLFTAIGVTWGGGDGTTSFNLPDFRGIFLRGVDGTAGNDPDKTTRTAKFTLGAIGNNVGSYQGDVFQGHWHGLYLATGDRLNRHDTFAAGSVFGPGFQTGQTTYPYAGQAITDGASGAPRTSSETRPKNAYVMYIIKVQ